MPFLLGFGHIGRFSFLCTRYSLLGISLSSEYSWYFTLGYFCWSVLLFTLDENVWGPQVSGVLATLDTLDSSFCCWVLCVVDWRLWNRSHLFCELVHVWGFAEVESPVRHDQVYDYISVGSICEV